MDIPEHGTKLKTLEPILDMEATLNSTGDYIYLPAGKVGVVTKGGSLRFARVCFDDGGWIQLGEDWHIYFTTVNDVSTGE